MENTGEAYKHDSEQWYVPATCIKKRPIKKFQITLFVGAQAIYSKGLKELNL